MNRTGPRVTAAALLLTVLAGCSGGGGLERYGGFTFVSPGGQSELTYPAAERGTIGDLSGPDLTSDGTINLSDYAGKVMVINVWGSWCGPCRAEADSLSLAATLTADKGVQFLGIDVRDTREAGADFQASRKVPYPSIFDPSMRTLLSISGYPTSSIPSTIVLDRDHRVAHIYLRVIQTGELVQTATDLAQETADSTTGSPSLTPSTVPPTGP
jgi:thiol-disulfide isomerase/thioredoxin